jgi:2-polyprenyl-3-methyl-5-hydroxy-6-metoxy-1,4-benzoquinol methylase
MNYNPIHLLQTRNNDVISGNSDLETIYTIKNFPVFFGISENLLEDDKFADMNFQISKSTGMVQVNPLVDLKTVYQSSHNPGTIGQIWKKHHQALSEFLLKFNKNLILEIGGYSGILANNCIQQNEDINWTIIDPHVKQFNNNIKIDNSFFDENYKSETKYDLIVHSHLIEHVTDINSFLRTCHKNLTDDGYMVFSLPNFDMFIDKRLTNSINFEHTYFINEYFLSKLFRLNGFELIEKTYYYEKFNIFYCVRKCNSEETTFDQSKYSEYKNKFLEYFDDINIFIKNTNAEISNNDNVFMFGGHVTSQFLLAMGLDESNIEYLLDNDPNKQGKRLYGTNLIVKSPSILSEYERPTLILKNSSFDEEIKNQIFEINKTTKILTF